MNLEKQRCPYCGEQLLCIQRSDPAEYFIHCNGCCARGPRGLSKENLTILPRLLEENLLRTVIDESPDIVFVKNRRGEFLLCNQLSARFYDSTPEQMLGKTDADFNDDHSQVLFVQKNIQEVISAGRVQVVEEASTNKATGEVRYFQSIKKPLKGPDGSDRVLVIAHDITELKLAYQIIEEKEKRYSYAMDAANEGIWDWDIEHNVVRHNMKWCQLLQLDDTLLTHDMAVLGKLIHADDIASMMSALNTALEGTGYYSSEHRMVRPDDSEIWVHDRGRVVEQNAEGKPLRMVGSITDITSRKVFERRLAETNRRIERSKEQLEGQVFERTAALARLNQELEELAKRDMLTGVGNRLRLDDWLVAQPEGNACVLVMLDVDHFKQVNDRYGHKVGDEVLQSIAQSLVLSVRRDDLVIRWGGEEFLIVLSPTDINQAVLIAENLRLRVSGLNALPDGSKVTVSLGVAGGLCREFDRVLVEADSAMYVAKQAGRNRVMAAPLAPEAIP